MAVLPLLLTAAILVWDRWVRRRGRLELRPVPPRAILALAYLAVLTHPALDWLNTYGVRLLAPFEWRWFYGDTLFIVDIWLWLGLGGTVVLARRPGHRGLALWGLLATLATLTVILGSPGGPGSHATAKLLWLAGLLLVALLHRLWRNPRRRPAGERVAAAGLALAAVYILTMGLSAAAARGLVQGELARRGLEPAAPAQDLLVGPEPYTPFDRQVVARRPGELHVGRFHWLPTPHLELGRAAIPIRREEPMAQAALGMPEVAGMVTWMRFPFFQVDATPEATVVWILDARYTQSRTTGFGGAAVRLEASPAPR